MGQKINATLFRLGIKNNQWKSKYFEKNIEEFSLYNYQNLEIKKYLKQFLDRNGLMFHDYKLYYTSNTLHLFISYYLTIKSVFFINKIHTNQKIKLRRKKFLKQKRKFLKQKSEKFENRINLLKKYKKVMWSNKYPNEKIAHKNSFLEQLFESLSIFTNKKFNIFVTFQNLNKGLSLKLNKIEKDNLKKKLLLLRKYSRNLFFKEAINILLVSIRVKNSAQLLAEFIAKQMCKMKKHNYFLLFLKRTLTIFLASKLSKINGIKIGIKGRFNGAPRARNKIILIGNVPIQTLTSNTKYYQTVSFTPNGTFGVKVWISEK